MSMSHSEKNVRGTPDTRSIPRIAPKASLIMLLSGLFLLFLSTLSVINTPAPAELTVFLAPISLFAGTVSGGFYCGLRLQGTEGYACAAISAAILTALLLAVKIIVPAPVDVQSLTFTVIFHILTVFAAVAGVFAANRIPKKRRRKKSRNRSKS